MAVYNPNIAPFINETFWVTSEFWEERPGPRYHKGLDIAVPFDLANPRDVYVYSMCDGVCIDRGYDADGYGNYLILKGNDGTGFLYGHLRIPQLPVLVDIGDPVTIGQAVGYEGSTGSSTGPHLHLEMQMLLTTNHWYHGDDITRYINPADWMGIPNVEGIECFYDGVPIFPTIKKRGFPWVLYAQKLRNKGKIY